MCELTRGFSINKEVETESLKGTPQRSGRVTHFKRNCGTFISLFSVGNSFKTLLGISVDLRIALVMLFPVQQIHSNFKPSCQIDKGYIKVPQNKFLYYTKYVGNKKR